MWRLPAWAHWCTAAADRPWTIGAEEEVMLLDAHTGALANRVDDALAVLPPALAARASAETHASVLEIRTAPHPTVAGLARELAAARSELASTLHARLALRPAAAGMHPLAKHSEVAVATGARYREIEATMRALAHREPTMALHLHVAVPDRALAVRVLDGLRADLPLLLALSANSPFWRGEDTGFASMRTPMFSMFPRVGIPRRFGSYRAYVDVVEHMVASGVIPEPTFLWWDARLQPKLGTVEVRVMDAQSRLADVAALAALVQALARLHADVPAPGTVEPELLAENRFLAARDGMRARLVDGRTGRSRPVRDLVEEMVEACRGGAVVLGCAYELAAVELLAADPGDARQRRVAAREGIAALPGRLGDEFLAAGRVPAVA
jgi:carboxylate-amine ligase